MKTKKEYCTAKEMKDFYFILPFKVYQISIPEIFQLPIWIILNPKYDAAHSD
jgi:hypothetical protein